MGVMEAFDVELDEEGYLRNPAQWSRALACAIASEEGLELDAER